jgi:hypothetical protein
MDPFLIETTKDSLIISLNFSAPILVSDELKFPDVLKVRIVEPQQIVSAVSGYYISERNCEAWTNIPRQLQKEVS